MGSLDGVPRRVISLNPSVNEFLALLGVELAGRDVFSYRPAELMKVPTVGTFIEVDLEVVRRIRPDLAVLYYPVQRHLVERLAGAAGAVVAVPTPVNIDQAVAVFRFFARVFDRDEEGDRLVGIYRDLFRGHPLYEDVVAVINLGVYDLACGNSYVADALTRVGLRYMRGLPCVFTHSEAPPTRLMERAGFVVYEARGQAAVWTRTGDAPREAPRGYPQRHLGALRPFAPAGPPPGGRRRRKRRGVRGGDLQHR